MRRDDDSNSKTEMSTQNFQGELDFTVKPPAQAHSKTSVAAAEQIEPFTGTQRGRVLEFIRRCEECGATDEEIQIGLSMNPSTQRPRRVELVRMGFIRDSGKVRPTQAGRDAVVWIRT